MLFLLFNFGSAFAEIIYVKYRTTPIDISSEHFKELKLKSSSVVNRIVFDKGNRYLLVQLNQTFYHYCGVPEHIVDTWQHATSLGTFYNVNIKGNYDCRESVVPEY